MSRKDKNEVILRQIQQARTVAIAGHINPDGDCLGAVTGLGNVLEAMGKEVDRIGYEKPDRLLYIPEVDKLRPVEEDKAYDLFILVDLGDRPRMGEAAKAFDHAKTSLNFDHHMTSCGDLCQYNWIEPEASSTCEIIASFVIKNHLPLGKTAATSLFAGIITDSNRFLYDTARARTLRVGADLIDRGADCGLVYFHEYQNNDPRILAFQGRLFERAEFIRDGQVVLLKVSQEDLKPYGISMADAEGCINPIRDLQKVEVVVMVKQMSEKFQKISFRSKLHFNVGQVAIHFGGGGHAKASGASIKGTIDEAYQAVKSYFLNPEVIL